MLSFLLPGLRELRTPLAAGYIWIANLWITIGGRLPSKDPGHGPLSAAWKFGQFLGKPALLVVLSFAAYLVGSFLEIDPLRMWDHGGRPAWLTRMRNLLRRVPLLSRLRFLPVSNQARDDIARFSEGASASATANPVGAMEILTNIMREENQIATRLQARNIDLYNKYDRLLGESSFRINIALPLAMFFLVVLWASPVSLPLKFIMTLASVGYAILLFRQGVQKAIRSRDVITQALAVGIVESTYLQRRIEADNASPQAGGPQS
ncbi:hypothetical protein [Actinacidiphila acidipaludis]|uniref:Type II secretion system protein GspF domain-containing protein n=1 Tax=Actinacidiphila acidipaludis TaxID=2873382 RepID=A0ABS7Q4D9_9ACTN|nr:hypothetical protein [Streptomyces acidipaludis]MBY8878023.1 hypothetical protein [Streptomyces acidipaludis]